VLARLVDANPEDVLVVYRHFPLNSIHDNAQKAAEASEAAGAQGAFWEYHDLLFETANDWSRKTPSEAQEFFVSLAEQLNLDTARFAQELNDGVYAEYVSGLEQEAHNLGLPGTPTAIINGRVAESLPPDISVWQQFVDSEVEMREFADQQFDAAPEMTIDEAAQYFATVTLANGDQFKMELYPQSAPQTVNSFVFLANEGWFDGVTFHRVIPGFVAQTGDPTGTGRGGPGYTIPNEIDPDLSHAEKGMVAMANSGPDTNGSQWYITLDDVSQLDGGYTIFGRVVAGMEVVEAITPRDPNVNPDAPEGDKIESIEIEEVKP